MYILIFYHLAAYEQFNLKWRFQRIKEKHLLKLGNNILTHISCKKLHLHLSFPFSYLMLRRDCKASSFERWLISLKIQTANRHLSSSQSHTFESTHICDVEFLNDVVWTCFTFMDLHNDVSICCSSILHWWPVLGTFVLWRHKVK